MFGDVAFDVTRAHVSVPFEEQLEALHRLVAAGKARTWGLSNETAWGVARFCELSRSRGAAGPAVLSNAFNLLCRTAETTVAEACHEEAVAFFAYSPLAMGLLAGHYRAIGGRWVDHADRRMVRYRRRYAEAESRYGPRPNVVRALARYQEVADECGLSLAEMSLRWVLHRPLVSGVVLGFSSLQQLRELLRCQDELRLDRDTLAALDAVHAAFPDPCP